MRLKLLEKITLRDFRALLFSRYTITYMHNIYIYIYLCVFSVIFF